MLSPVWFNEDFYLSEKLAQVKTTDPNTPIATETQLKAIISNAGITVYDHYVKYGETEGISPNAYFSPILYARAVAESWNASNYLGETVWNEQDILNISIVRQIPLYNHYLLSGSTNGVNPSNLFDTSAYIADKAVQCGMSPNALLQAIITAGYDPISHYLNFGKAEGLEAKVVQGPEAVLDLAAWNPLPQDPLFAEQWHLYNTGQQNSKLGVDINVTDVWRDYTGKGVTIGICDDGVQQNHPDLIQNINTALALGSNQGNPVLSDDNHGTAVAGVAAEPSNNLGGVGVAWEATLASVRVLGGGENMQYYDQALLSNNYDILNNSWGSCSFGSSESIAEFKKEGLAEQLAAVTYGRNGLGTIIVYAAGNGAQKSEDGNLSVGSANPYMIAVGAVGSTGEISPYSSPYSGVLVAAPSNSTTENLGITTTDRTGYSGYNAAASPEGDYNSEFGGTSSACPTVAGVVALMLEANPNLGYRDVKDILALSATSEPLVKDSINTTTNGATNWNGGGMVYNNQIGFGLVDTHAAVRLAETWTNQSTQSNELFTTQSQAINYSPTDNEKVASSLQVTENIETEAVMIYLNITHKNATDLVIKLTSPSGVTMTLLEHAISQENLPNELDGYMPLLASGFYGEKSQGQWTLEIEDTVGNNITPTIHDWTIEVTGKALTTDNTYFYTNDYASIATSDITRTTLTDTEGTDTLNLSALSSGVFADLRSSDQGGNGVIINNTKLNLNATIENIFTTDYDDIVISNQANNSIATGRGNDVIYLQEGSNNYVNGNTGFNVVVMQGLSTSYNWMQDNDRIIMTNGYNTQVLENVSQIFFTDQVVTIDYFMV